MIYTTDIKLNNTFYRRVYKLLSTSRDPIHHALNKDSASFSLQNAKLILDKPYVQIISRSKDIKPILGSITRITGINLLEAEVV